MKLESKSQRKVVVGSDLKDHADFCNGQGQLPLDWLTQTPIQPGLENLQGQRVYNLSG